MLAGFVFFLLFLFAKTMLWAWVLMFLAVFCLFFNTGPANTILANVTHPSMRASAFALNIFVIHALGDAISPPIIGYIAGVSRGAETATTGLTAGFLAVSVMILVGGVLWLWGARYLQKDTALAPTRLD
jgi:MFS transporter, Spinster family, sphingosine-1-phosphate transporter